MLARNGRCITLVAVIVIPAWSGCLIAQSSSSGSDTVSAVSASGEIKLDGRLEESDWLSAGVIAQLVPQSPRPGEPTAFKTEVRVLIIKDTLFFGFRCADPVPAKVAIHSMARDGGFPDAGTVEKAVEQAISN